jgi:GNAT superfamily N-acetyltransferase
MADVTVDRASDSGIRTLLRRHQFTDTDIRLALELVQRGTVWEALDDGEPVGLAIAHASEGERFVGALFVEPSYRLQGVGGRLLDAALADSGDAARRLFIDPADAAGCALALRRGIVPHGIVLTVSGAIPREEGLFQMAAGAYRFEVDAIDLAQHASAIDALDRETRGTQRPGDHELFVAGATGHAFFLNGEFVGYTYVWPDGLVGPMATSAPAYTVQIFAYALVTLQRAVRASWCRALIPATNIRLAQAAVRAGLRIEASLALAGDAIGACDLSRYAGFHRLLF